MPESETPLCPVCECGVVDDLVYIGHPHLGEVPAHSECLPVDVMLGAIWQARRSAADLTTYLAEANDGRAGSLARIDVLRDRVTELETELDLQRGSQARLVVQLANAKREPKAYPLSERCQATTVDPTNVFKPSCAWCVLPAGHQGMHRAELTQDAEPATLEWLDSTSGAGEVTA